MSNAKLFKYYIAENGGHEGDFYTAESTWNEEFTGHIAEDCAVDYHKNHDGWDDVWPLDFVVEIAGVWIEFEIEREHTPTFTAGEKEVRP